MLMSSAVMQGGGRDVTSSKLLRELANSASSGPGELT